MWFLRDLVVALLLARSVLLLLAHPVAAVAADVGPARSATRPGPAGPLLRAAAAGAALPAVDFTVRQRHQHRQRHHLIAAAGGGAGRRGGRDRPNGASDATVISAEAGGSAGLPCDIDSELADQPVLVRWFRVNNASDGAPFYILDDAQRRGIWNGNHDISVDFAGRAFFSALSSPASLRLSRLGPSDSGRYVCSVSFHSGEVRNHNVSLRVGVSPSVPVLTDGEGSILASSIGPYYVGHNLRINCIVENGLPIPSIVWKRNGVPIAAAEHQQRMGVEENAKNVISTGASRGTATPPTYRISSQTRTEGAHSILDVGRLGRNELRATFSCEASNEIAEQPLETAVTVDLILPPLSVEIEHGGVLYSAGAQAEFRCRVAGSRPFPVVTWLLATRKLEAFFSHVSEEDDGNTTVSTLLLTMSPVENDQKLICRVTNHQLPGSTWEDSIQLNIIHAPVVSLQSLGTTHEPAESVEIVASQGQDVSFECTITANPPASRVFWTLNDRLLNDVDSGELEDNALVGTFAPLSTPLLEMDSQRLQQPPRRQHQQQQQQQQYNNYHHHPIHSTGHRQIRRLTLRNVTAAQHNGRYNCDVTNPLGSVRSNDLELRVRYPPRCHSSVERSYRYGGSSKSSSTKTPPTLLITCLMDADPRDRLHFTWIAYNSSGSKDWHVFHPSAHQIVNETSSQLNYRASSLTEEVTIECWANNTAYVLNNSSRDPEPCVFRIEPYGVPPALEGCQVVNQAQSWFFLECDPTREFDDKAKEFYLLELYNADNGQLLANTTSDEPVFQAMDIPDGTECVALVFAVNSKGRSDPSRVIIQAISPPSKLLTSGVGASLTAMTSLVASLVVFIAVAYS